MSETIFIGSSVNSLKVAYAIQENLEYDFDVTVWDQDIFELSSDALTDLLWQSKINNYAIFVFNTDDIIKSKSTTSGTVRDNVVFEFGLFISALGRDKVFYVTPRGHEELKLPTDILGITPGTYNSERVDSNLNAALGPFCNKVRKQISQNIKGSTVDYIEVKARRDFDRMEKIIEVAESEVFISGINLDAAVNASDLISRKIQESGVQFNLLCMKESAQGLDAFSVITNVDPGLRQNKIKTNIELLKSKLKTEIMNGNVEIRQFDGIICSGCIGIDVNTAKGKLIAQHYLYNITPDSAPIITMTRQTNRFWYSIYAQQLLENWDASEKIYIRG